MAYSAAQGRASLRYRASHQDRIEIKPQIQTGQAIRAAAAAAGESIQGWIVEAARRRCAEDGQPWSGPSGPRQAEAPAPQQEADPLRGLSDEARRTATASAEAAGIEPGEWIERAITTQAQRDRIAGALVRPKPKPKTEASTSAEASTSGGPQTGTPTP